MKPEGPGRPPHLYRPIDFALHIIRLNDVLKGGPEEPTEEEKEAMYRDHFLPMFEAAKAVVLHEDRLRIARGLPPLFGGCDE